MRVQVIKGFPDSTYGLLRKNAVVTVPDATAKRWIMLGLVNPCGQAEYDTKVVNQVPTTRPMQAAGQEQQSSVSPVAQASQETTVKQSDNGKKRGRPPKSASFQ